MGIPVLAVTGLVHLIDKIILAIRKKSLRAEIQEKQQEIRDQAHPGVKNLHNKISSDRDTLLRQGFFNVVKTRNQSVITPLDRMGAVHRPFKSTPG